jgi:hypothetical protein
MYPEECFDFISHDVVDQCFKGEEEWWKKDESLGTGHRVGWKCKECGWVYFVRLLEFVDIEDPHSDDTFVTARES